MQTTFQRPLGYPAMLFSCDLDPAPVDGGLPPVVAHALGAALTAYGTVALRLFFSEPTPPGARLWLPAPRGPFARIIEYVRRNGPVPVITTRSSDAVAARLDDGWSMQWQAALVLDPATEAEAEHAAHHLGRVGDWREFRFPAPISALVAPGVDGDFVLVTAASADHLHGLVDCLGTAFRAAGFALPADWSD